MTANILDGKALALKIQDNLKKNIQKMVISPVLAVIAVGESFSSKIYIKKKYEACKNLGIDFKLHNFKKASQKDLIELIDRLNESDEVHGILVQLPLPSNIDVFNVVKRIDPKKDVDCLTPYNLGCLAQNRARFHSCTAKGITRLLQNHIPKLAGLNALVIGASNIVGKPIYMELINLKCTTAICQSTVKNLKELTNQADLLISAVGKANLIKEDWIKKGAILVDVGINYLDKKLVGDIDQKAKDKASWITPVPGGIGPMTVTMLMENVVEACCRKSQEK